MKTKYTNIISLFILILVVISSCHKRVELDKFWLGDYDRRVGTEGKMLVFLRNYNDDSIIEDTLFIMDVPENALDTSFIFNFYEYNSEILDYEVYKEFGLGINSKFFYISPFREFVNNNDSTSDYKVDNHLSIDMYKPATFTYFIDTTTYPMLSITDKLYRIIIPMYDEWPENIWTKFNNQGYPQGFEEADLYFLINGKWSSDIDWGEGDYSTLNWEEVEDYTINPKNNTVTFNMYDTDYLYVICYDAYKKGINK